MKYSHKGSKIKSNKGRRWFKRTLKRSERAIAQEEVKNQVNEVIDTISAANAFPVQVR